MTVAAHVFLQTLRRIRAAEPADVRHYQAVMLARLVDFSHRLVPGRAEALATMVEEDGVALERWETIPVLTRAHLPDAGLTVAERPEALGSLHDVRPADLTGAALVGPVDHDFLWADVCVYETLFEDLKLDGRGTVVDLRSVSAIDPADPQRQGWSFQRTRGVARLVDEAAAPDDITAALAEVGASGLIGDIGALARLAVAGADLPETVVAVLGHGVAPAAVLSGVRGWAERQGKACGFVLSLPETGAFDVAGASGDIASADGVVFTEILDAAGRPVAPGWPGRLVVTPLYAFTRPLLRFDTGLRAVRPPDRWNGLML